MGCLKLSYYENTELKIVSSKKVLTSVKSENKVRSEYLYGMNGQEKSTEINDNSYTAEFWQYDGRIGRRWNVDPVSDPSQSSYACFNNNPIAFNDINGDCPDCPDEEVESKYLGGMGVNMGSFGNGIADGFIGALPEVVSFAWDMITDEGARDEFITGMKTVMADPLGAIKAIAGEKYNLYSSVLSGNGTQQQQYEVGKEIGNLLFGVATGAAAAKLSEVIKVAKAEKKAADAAMAAKKVAGGGCFVEGTLVLTTKGLIEIEKLHKGDTVWTYNIETKKHEQNLIKNAYTRRVNKLVKVSIGTIEIVTTIEHPFFINGIWVSAGNLAANDTLTTYDNCKLPISSTTTIDTNVVVYNFTVKNNHDYFVSVYKVLVHNIDCTPRLKSPTKLRKEWSEINAKKWPKEKVDGKKVNKIAHHKKPLADGGLDHGSNIKPMTRKAHTTHHKKNGDFQRWGKRRAK